MHHQNQCNSYGHYEPMYDSFAPHGNGVDAQLDSGSPCISNSKEELH